jgi:hypothetical protein
MIPTFPIQPVPSSLPLTASYQDRIIRAQTPNGTFLLEIFPIEKEIYFLAPQAVAGKLYGTYSSSLSENKTYFTSIEDKKVVGYVNTIIE